MFFFHIYSKDPYTDNNSLVLILKLSNYKVNLLKTPFTLSSMNELVFQ